VWLRKLGHSCLLAEEADARILIDPGCLSDRFEDLSGLSGILISHIHDDHLDIDRLLLVLERNPSVRVLCDEASGVSELSRGGYRNRLRCVIGCEAGDGTWKVGGS
jgi:L-ascorbate metabolism protein UlaG (beta-lactamase superfamily)